MSHDRRDESRSDDAANAQAGAAVSAWLRALATRAETDAAFAAQMLAAARESGLTGALPTDTAGANSQSSPAPTRGARTRNAARATAPSAQPPPPPDPFGIYRAQGEAGLRAILEGLELATLRVIVRERRLDPARISARWTARERVIALIVDQVRARAQHGHAFERV
jgi:hypothetical protein